LSALSASGGSRASRTPSNCRRVRTAVC
jgi:hypothetical protein